MSTIPTYTSPPTPPNREDLGANRLEFRQNANAWNSWVWDFFTTPFNSILDWIDTKTKRVEELESRLTIATDGDSSCCLNNQVLSAPIIVGTDKIVVNHEATFIFSSTSLLSEQSIQSYTIDWGDGTSGIITTGTTTHIYASGEIDDTFTITVHAVDSLGNLSTSTTHTVTIVDKFIDTPIEITIDGSPDLVVQNAKAQLTELPNTVGTTIDKVYFRVIKASDNVQVGDTRETTDLSLPITFNSPDLVPNTKYYFEFQCVSEADNIQSCWTYVEGKTKDKLTKTLVFDRFGEDNQMIAKYLLFNDSNDLGLAFDGVDTNVTYTGSSVVFDGSSAIKVDYDFSNVKAISLWANWTDEDNIGDKWETILGSKRINQKSNNQKIVIHGSNGLCTYHDGSEQVIDSDYGMGWHHIVINKLSNGNYDYYIDNIKKGSDLPDNNASLDLLYIGSDNDKENMDEAFVGEIALVEMFEDNLTLEQIESIFNENREV